MLHQDLPEDDDNALTEVKNTKANQNWTHHKLEFFCKCTIPHRRLCLLTHFRLFSSKYEIQLSTFHALVQRLGEL